MFKLKMNMFCKIIGAFTGFKYWFMVSVTVTVANTSTLDSTTANIYININIYEQGS